MKFQIDQIYQYRYSLATTNIATTIKVDRFIVIVEELAIGSAIAITVLRQLIAVIIVLSIKRLNPSIIIKLTFAFHILTISSTPP